MSEVTDARYLRIHFNDGETRSYAYEALGGDNATLASRVNNMLASSHFILTHEDRLEIIPFASIKSVEIAPPPDVNVSHSIKILHNFKL